MAMPQSTSSYQNIASNNVPPSRESHVQSQMSRQGSIVEHITQMMETLEHRLTLLLRQELSPENKKELAQPALVGHAMAIANHNEQLVRISDALDSICDRLEI